MKTTPRANRRMAWLRQVGLGLLLILVVQGCSTPRTVPLGGAVARAGIDVSQSAIDEYGRIDQLADIAAERELMQKAVVLPAGSTMVLQPAPPRRFADALTARRSAFRSLGDAYEAYNQLSDTAFSADAQAASTKLVDAAGALSAAAKVPVPGGEALDKLPALAGFAVGQLQAGQIKEQNAALAKLAAAASELWDHDQPTFERYIDTVFDGLPKTIADLPTSAFDMKTVAELSAEPYAPDVKLRLYKVQQFRLATDEKTQAKEGLESVSPGIGRARARPRRAGEGSTIAGRCFGVRKSDHRPAQELSIEFIIK